MRTRLTAAAVGLALISLPAACETLTLHSQSLAGIYSSPLLAGTTYEITVSGVYDYGNAPDTYADAEWSRPPNWSEVVSGYSAQTDILDVVIDDSAVDWEGTADGVHFAPHVFSATHIYRYYYTGAGAPIRFHIADLSPWGGDATSDNEGSLTLDLRPVPEPPTLLALLSGAAGAGAYAAARRRPTAVAGTRRARKEGPR